MTEFLWKKKESKYIKKWEKISKWVYLYIISIKVLLEGR